MAWGYAQKKKKKKKKRQKKKTKKKKKGQEWSWGQEEGEQRVPGCLQLSAAGYSLASPLLDAKIVSVIIFILQ